MTLKVMHRGFAARVCVVLCVRVTSAFRALFHVSSASLIKSSSDAPNARDENEVGSSNPVEPLISRCTISPSTRILFSCLRRLRVRYGFICAAVISPNPLQICSCGALRRETVHQLFHYDQILKTNDRGIEIAVGDFQTHRSPNTSASCRM